MKLLSFALQIATNDILLTLARSLLERARLQRCFCLSTSLALTLGLQAAHCTPQIPLMESTPRIISVTS